MDSAWLAGVETVGITAGASAPEELVQGVIERLSEYSDVEVEKLSGVVENITFKLPRELTAPVASTAAE
jgi:4-hydroxy-3-methylbut-2-enyl diphosphate reductase